MKRVVRLSVQPGKPLAPQASQQLQQASLNADEVARRIADETKPLASYGVNSVTVEVIADDGDYSLSIEYPSITDLLIRAAGKSAPTHQAGKEIIGDIQLEKVAEVTLIKLGELRSTSFVKALKQVVGTCRSIGLTVNGKDPKDVIKEIDAGKYDELVKKYEEEAKKVSGDEH
ncbi:50S ribosomal protein L11 [Thermocladium modestius]|uniref:Large ribosomal subunit protein uL11 n=1 Tax=Thermocladium modestius TaxID=62609 RepID=A0A830GUP9_9CREN|nr:50S ribosomal protein L11 [Thermocladium modestius]GGP21112.1 50S ribosomal protein L11 [Thermocladium modestius]